MNHRRLPLATKRRLRGCGEVSQDENGRAVYRFTLRIKLPETPSKARYGF